jgi:hypothetical protein
MQTTPLDAPEKTEGQFSLQIVHQESYSRGQLLLRTFFGGFYIALPHFIVLIFCALWGAILAFISWWAILFTGKYPKSFFEYQVKLHRWQIRLVARLLNLADGYPAIGPNGSDDHTTLEIPYPETLSRGILLLRAFFGQLYVLLPHGIILYLRIIWGAILGFLAFWVILFTGKYPVSWFNFQVANLRWGTRVSLYMSFMTDNYPPFNGRE